MSEGGKKLTKKEKKAQAFRSSKNTSKPKTTQELPFQEEDAVPVEEDINEAERAPVEKVVKEGKKRKRDEEGSTTVETGDAAEGDDDVPKKKKRQRGKKKSQQIRPGGVDEEGKPRLIVFVGKFLPSSPSRRN